MKTTHIASGVAALGAAFVAMGLTGHSAVAMQVDDSTDFSDRRSFCAQVNGIGNRFSEDIKANLNRMYSGLETEVTRRKTLITGETRSVEIDGCKIKIRMDAELKRKIRRDAEGYVDIEVTVRNYQILDRGRAARVCVKDPKLKKVKMSRTTRLGEKFYRKFGAKAVKRMAETGDCFNVALTSTR